MLIFKRFTTGLPNLWSTLSWKIVLHPTYLEIILLRWLCTVYATCQLNAWNSALLIHSVVSSLKTPLGLWKILSLPRKHPWRALETTWETDPLSSPKQPEISWIMPGSRSSEAPFFWKTRRPLTWVDKHTNLCATKTFIYPLRNLTAFTQPPEQSFFVSRR